MAIKKRRPDSISEMHQKAWAEIRGAFYKMGITEPLGDIADGAKKLAEQAVRNFLDLGRAENRIKELEQELFYVKSMWTADRQSLYENSVNWKNQYAHLLRLVAKKANITVPPIIETFGFNPPNLPPPPPNPWKPMADYRSTLNEILSRQQERFSEQKFVRRYGKLGQDLIAMGNDRSGWTLPHLIRRLYDAFPGLETKVTEAVKAHEAAKSKTHYAMAR